MPGKPRKRRIFEGLLRRLAVGQWASGCRLPPVRELEREFGVSHATMLAALRLAAEQGLVAVQSRRPVTVLPGARDLARRLLESRAGRPESGRVAVMVPERLWPVDDTPFFGEFMAAIRGEAEKHGLAVEAVKWPVVEQVAFAHSLPDRGFDAAFAIAVRAEYLAALYVLHQQRFPLVVFNAKIPQLRLPAVNMDEYGAARQMATRLVALGHRNLCLVSWAFDTRLRGDQHRVMGWLDYLKESNLIGECLMPVVYATAREDVMATFGRIFGFPDRPTAVVFAYEPLCLAFLEHPAHRHMKVPDRVSIATFDPVPHVPAGSWCPPVTTILSDMTRAAQCVFELVQETMKGNLEPRSIRVPMHIDATGSIGPPPPVAHDSGHPSSLPHGHGRSSGRPPDP